MIATDTEALAGIEAAVAAGEMVAFAPAATDAEILAGIAAAVEAGEMYATQSSAPIAWALGLAEAETAVADAEEELGAAHAEVEGGVPTARQARRIGLAVDTLGEARTNVRNRRRGLYVALRHDGATDAAARRFAGVSA